MIKKHIKQSKKLSISLIVIGSLFLFAAVLLLIYAILHSILFKEQPIFIVLENNHQSQSLGMYIESVIFYCLSAFFILVSALTLTFGFLTNPKVRNRNNQNIDMIEIVDKDEKK